MPPSHHQWRLTPIYVVAAMVSFFPSFNGYEIPLHRVALRTNFDATPRMISSG